MTEPQRLGVVCEGRTDFQFFDGLLNAALATEFVFRSIQPGDGSLAGGCLAVRQWCQRFPHPNLTWYIRNNGLDLLLVVLDGDTAPRFGVTGDPSEERNKRLCTLIRQDWFRLEQDHLTPEQLLISLPRLELEGWILARRGLASIADAENIQDAKERLKNAMGEEMRRDGFYYREGELAWAEREMMRGLESWDRLETKLTSWLARSRVPSVVMSG